MVSTWIEAAAKGRHGGPVYGGMWSAVVIGTHPIESNQEVRLEITVDDRPIGPLPAYWLENKGPNSFWHVPVPPQPVGSRLKYRSVARQNGSDTVYSPPQEIIVRPNLPDRTETAEITMDSPEGLVGNRMMTAKVDGRGSTYDIYFPTVGLHSDVRPSEGDRPQSRSHFRAILGGLAANSRIDWFNERRRWEVFQYYQGATNLLVTELKWRSGPLRVWATDFAVMGKDLPRTSSGSESHGQYIKRFRVKNEADEKREALFGLFVHAEVNGGVGETGLSWRDGEMALLAINRGHAHANRKLARDATVEFAIALDGAGTVHCEPTGPDAAILIRKLEIPPGESVTVNVLVSGAFTGWRGDNGTFSHWLEPALAWFRAMDIDQLEQAAAQEWDAFVEPLPILHFPRPAYGVCLRRSALAAALHSDQKWGAIASGYERGLSAYCWPREAIRVGGTFDRLGRLETGAAVYDWLARVRGKNRPYLYWFQKYTIDGWPEWETPAIDQTAMIPWGLELHYRRSGDLDFLSSAWPLVEQAALVCAGGSKHPGLLWLDDLSLFTSAGLWDQGFGAFLYSNACVVAGLRAAARIAETLEKDQFAERWREQAELIWNKGVMPRVDPLNPQGPGLVEAGGGRFLEARRVSKIPGVWSGDPDRWIDVATNLDISILGACVPLGLIAPDDPRVLLAAEAILKHNFIGGESNILARSAPGAEGPAAAASRAPLQDASCLATLWMARYLIRLGKETGQGRHLTRAMALIDSIVGRLGPLLMSVRLQARRADDPSFGFGPDSTTGIWGLHAQLIECLLDLAGLEFDAVDRRFDLAPGFPPAWPSIGVTQTFACGEVEYRLDRTQDPGSMRLRLRAKLNSEASLVARIACPALESLSRFSGGCNEDAPRFDGARHILHWSAHLPEGESQGEWSWG